MKKVANPRIAFPVASLLLLGGCAGNPTLQKFTLDDGTTCVGDVANDHNVLQDDNSYAVPQAVVAAHLKKGDITCGDTPVEAQRATPLVRGSEVFNNITGPLATGAEVGVEARSLGGGGQGSSGSGSATYNTYNDSQTVIKRTDTQSGSKKVGGFGNSPTSLNDRQWVPSFVKVSFPQANFG